MFGFVYPLYVIFFHMSIVIGKRNQILLKGVLAEIISAFFQIVFKKIIKISFIW